MNAIVEYYSTVAMQSPTAGAKWLVGTFEIRNRNSLAILQTIPVRAVNSRVPGGAFCAAWPAVDDFEIPTLALAVTVTPVTTTIPNTGTIVRSFVVNCTGGTGVYTPSAAVTVQPSRGTLTVNSVTPFALNVTASVVSATSAGSPGNVRLTVVSGAETVQIDIPFTDAFVYVPPGGGPGGGPGIGCPTLDMYVSTRYGNIPAGQVMVGEEILLADQHTGEEVYGTVTRAETMLEECVHIELSNGVWLDCSTSAPLGTADGQILAPESGGIEVYSKLLGHKAYNDVVSVESIGQREVRLITVGDRFYWVGGAPGKYVLHHNIKVGDTTEIQ